MATVNPGIMVRQLKKAYPSNAGFHDFVHDLEERFPEVLRQLYSDVMHGARLIQTVEEWNAIPEQAGWNASNFCSASQK
jgi:hypothetical protein